MNYRLTDFKFFLHYGKGNFVVWFLLSSERKQESWINWNIISIYSEQNGQYNVKFS